MSNRPLLIVLSATRNYGWCTRAFLEANSRWADYIILVDQMSTDGTREMCSEYPNVILLDDKDLSYSETRRCEMALKRAREIKGDKVLFYLAIDEIFPANWQSTEDGKKILASSVGDMFFVYWANLLPDREKCVRIKSDGDYSFMYRVFHDDGVTPYDNGGLDMHTYALPYCEKGRERFVRDFPLLHFGVYNQAWSYVKQHYYEMVDYDKNGRSVVTLSRMYNPESAITFAIDSIEGEPVEKEWFWGDFDVYELVDTHSVPYLCVYMHELIAKNTIRHYRTLDVWDKKMLDYLQLKDPRPWWIKPVHYYLHITMNARQSIMVRAIDKILKQLI